MKRAGVYTMLSFAAAMTLTGTAAGQASAHSPRDAALPIAGPVIINNGFYGDITNTGKGNTNNIHIGDGPNGTQGGAGITQGGTGNVNSALLGGTKNTQGGAQGGTGNVQGGTQGGAHNTDTQGGTQGGTNNTQGGTQSGTRNTQGGAQSGTGNTQGAVTGATQTGAKDTAEDIAYTADRIIADTFRTVNEQLTTPLP
ncbi:hypothetical protein [Streptomyces collinus]|uniref:hypothetical protein n=1 Tax=Streptomyces collinus TaxID=42684 RepID=UPI0011DC94C3|nr:hypothetical protein [Streptomyces collinus]